MVRGGSKGALGWDPAAALTVAEAAGLAGVSEAALRRRIQGGEILHEVGRRAGREVQLVRLVDLLEAYPDLLQPVRPPAQAAPPREAPPEVPEPGLPPPPADPRAPEDTRAAAAERESPPVRGAEPARPEDERLASIQALNEALRREVALLEGQRGDLRELCADLRERLGALERERQAGSAAWLLAERRFLALEARPAQVSPSGARRRAALAGLGALALLGALAALAWRGAGSRRELAGLRATVESALGAAEGDRARWTEELEHRRLEREQLFGDLAGARQEERAERTLLAQRIERLAEQSAELARTLAAERGAAAEERTRLARALAASGERAAAVQRSLEDERGAAEQRASAERERQAALERRIDELQGALAAASSTTEGLRAEWEARAGSLQEHAGRLEAEIVRLEGEREAERRRALERAQRFVAGLFLGGVPPFRQPEILSAPRASTRVQSGSRPRR